MLLTVNRLLEKAMPFITPVSVVAGVLLAHYIDGFVFLIPWIFAFITFTGSLGSNFTSLKRVVLNPLPTLIVLIVLHFLMPLWAFAMGHLVFPGDMFTITGLILGVIIPTGVTSLMWVSIYKGNTVLALTIVLLDTLLSPFIVPYSVGLFAGGKIEMDMWGMTKGLVGMIVIPSILAMLLNQATKGKIKGMLSPKLSPFSKICLGLVVMLNSSKIAPYLSEINHRLIVMAAMVLLIASSGYVLSWFVGKLFKWDTETIITITFTGGMRNISAGSVIAVSYFPSAVAVPVILGMLFQQILASVFGYLLDRHYHKPTKSEAAAS
ncbi:bile acid:sodium symporter family protein [Bacillus massiliglaciei]|uniref:bile acid:sodium symporter family protein n=1 Tax=Bacillus massiliglaciei TaxID=1816693 RepID=UPI000AA4FA8C|nr:bile acid:sodium symporter family protein [Bacillus massiliglaciei]